MSQSELQSCEVHRTETGGVLPLAGLGLAIPPAIEGHGTEPPRALLGLDAVQPDRKADAVAERAELFLGAARRLRQLLGFGHGSPPFKKRNGCFQTFLAHG